MAQYRVLRTAQATITRTFFLDELPTDADGSVAVTAARLDGTDVPALGAAATGPDANHAYTYTFAGLDVLDEVTLTWAATVGGDAITLDQDHVQVVGGFYFSLSEGRGADSALASTTTYPTADLIRIRTETEDECERITGQAFVPRFAREVLSGEARSELRLEWPWVRALRRISIRPSISAAYVDMTADQLAMVAPGDDGVLRMDQGFFWPTTAWSAWGWQWPMGRRNIIIEYEHGLDYPPPDIVRGAKLRFKSIALQPKSRVPDRAERLMTTELGVVTLATPSKDSTGIPEVDAAYQRAPRPVPSFG